MRSVADRADGCIRCRAVRLLIFSRSQPSVVAAGRFSGRLTGNNLAFVPQIHIYNASLPAATAGAATTETRMQGAVKG